MKIKNIRRARKGLAWMLAANLYITRMFYMQVLPEREFSLAINNNGTDSYQQGVQVLPFLREEEYKLTSNDNGKENDSARKLVRKQCYAKYRSNYRRKPRDKLNKTNYYDNSRDF